MAIIQRAQNQDKLKNFASLDESNKKTKKIRRNLPSLKTPKKFKLGKAIKGFFSNKEILKKLGTTILVVVIYRFLSSVPLPGINMGVYKDFFGTATASEANYLFTIFTGGQLNSPSIVGLGIAAYINASIIIQLMTPVIPKLDALSKEGERGTQTINQYTRYLTLPLSFLYSAAYVLLMAKRDLNSTDGVTTSSNPQYLINAASGSEWPSIYKIVLMALVLAAGTMIVMWLSELITEKGLGNGSSIIIAVGILSSLPALISQDFSLINFKSTVQQVFAGNFASLTSNTFLVMYGIIIGFLILIAAIIFISESIRKIPIHYSRSVTELSDTSLPIKLTVTGVLPIIFASSLLSVPQLIIPLIQNAVKDTNSALYKFADTLNNSFLVASNDNVVNSNDFKYAVVYFLLILAFGVFYSFILMRPSETAENLHKRGAFVPEVRPGKSTEKYIAFVLLRIGLVGAMFLGVIALIPLLSRVIVISRTGQTMALLSGIGGTSILIVVSVVLDTVRQYQSLKVSRSYEKYI